MSTKIEIHVISYEGISNYSTHHGLKVLSGYAENGKPWENFKSLEDAVYHAEVYCSAYQIKVDGVTVPFEEIQTIKKKWKTTSAEYRLGEYCKWSLPDPMNDDPKVVKHRYVDITITYNNGKPPLKETLELPEKEAAKLVELMSIA
jgi:hypothetical protein